MVNFVFRKEMEEIASNDDLEIMTTVPLDWIRGLALPGEPIVNLSSLYWKELEEEQLIIELDKTMTHEFVHYLLQETKTKLEGEEKICRIMANQTPILPGTKHLNMRTYIIYNSVKVLKKTG